jgi:hypothetical protein
MGMNNWVLFFSPSLYTIVATIVNNYRRIVVLEVMEPETEHIAALLVVGEWLK